MIYVFFFECVVVKLLEIFDIVFCDIVCVGVIGGGIMGVGIVILVVLNGFVVILVECDLEVIDKVCVIIVGNFDVVVKCGKFKVE